MRKAYIKSNITAAITALIVLGIGAWLANYALNDGSVYWLLLAIPVIQIGVFFLGIGPLVKPIRILMCVVACCAFFVGIWGLISFEHPWNAISLAGGLECVFVSIPCIVFAAQAEASYEQYKKAIQAEKEQNV